MSPPGRPRLWAVLSAVLCPVLRDFDSLDQTCEGQNARLAFDLAEREFGIAPLVSVEEMSSAGEPDPLSMVMYLSQFYQLLKDTPPPAGERRVPQPRDRSLEDETARAVGLAGVLGRGTDLLTPAVLLSRLAHSTSTKVLHLLLSLLVFFFLFFFCLLTAEVLPGAEGRQREEEEEQPGATAARRGRVRPCPAPVASLCPAAMRAGL